jgi:hypothetical protein
VTKKHGFKIRIDAFVEIDKKDFGKQAAAFALMDTIKRTNKLPDDFLTTATITSIDAKQGSADIPDPTAAEPFPETTAAEPDPTVLDVDAPVLEPTGKKK